MKPRSKNLNENAFLTGINLHQNGRGIMACVKCLQAPKVHLYKRPPTDYFPFDTQIGEDIASSPSTSLTLT